jgi:PAB-dependent poly(A)-specific ribonuclease subunit 2
MITRRGLTQWHLTHDEMVDLRCMSCAEISTLFHHRVAVLRGQLIDDCALINIYSEHDAVVKSWKAHGTGVNDMDARNDLLVTCGFSVRHLGSLGVDLFVKPRSWSCEV